MTLQTRISATARRARCNYVGTIENAIRRVSIDALDVRKFKSIRTASRNVSRHRRSLEGNAWNMREIFRNTIFLKYLFLENYICYKKKSFLKHSFF